MAQGRLYPGALWYEGEVNWVEIVSGIQVPPDTGIHLALPWVNESEEVIPGHIEVSVEYPANGETTATMLSAVSNQDNDAEPGAGWYVQFEPFTTSIPGTYIVTATLSTNGEVLDSTTFELDAAPVVDGGGGDMLQASMGPVMMIVLLGFMMGMIRPVMQESQ